MCFPLESFRLLSSIHRILLMLCSWLLSIAAFCLLKFSDRYPKDMTIAGIPRMWQLHMKTICQHSKQVQEFHYRHTMPKLAPNKFTFTENARCRLSLRVWFLWRRWQSWLEDAAFVQWVKGCFLWFPFSSSLASTRFLFYCFKRLIQHCPGMFIHQFSLATPIANVRSAPSEDLKVDAPVRSKVTKPTIWLLASW